MFIDDEVDIEEIFPNKDDKDAIIPMCFDKLYKKVFANKNNLKPLEELLSICLPIDLEDIKGNVSLTSNEPVVENKRSKKRVLDVICEVVMPKGKRSVINLEINLSKSTVIRNLGYATKVYSNEVEAGEDYNDIPAVIQLCFDYFEVNKYNDLVQKKFYLKDETNQVMYDKLEIRHVNIEKARKMWYSNNISKGKENESLVKLAALLTIKNKEDFQKCLEEIPMEEATKKEIEEAVMDYSKDNKSWLAVDAEKEKIKLMKTEIGTARQEGIELGIEQEKIEIAKNLIKMNMNIQDISKATGLSEEELVKLKD